MDSVRSIAACIGIKAADATRSLGSIIGKALAPLPEGQGLISILVSLH
jgi:hypothetical protein